MTLEELKDLIDSTINENGKKSITGKTLNLVLNAIAENAGSSASSMLVHIPPTLLGGDSDLTEGQKAENVLARQAILDAYTNDTAAPIISGFVKIEQDGATQAGWLSSIITSVVEQDGVQKVLLALAELQFEIAADGSINSMSGSSLSPTNLMHNE